MRTRQLTHHSPFVAYDVTELHSTRMKGDTARMARFYDRVESAGSALGIAFRWGGRTGSTRASHRLIRLARERDRAAPAPASPTDVFEAGAAPPPPPPPASYQDDVLEALFRGHFEGERDVSDLAFLADVAARTGLLPSAPQAARVLAGDGSELARAVEAEERRARALGVAASPSYVVQGRYSVGGCQEPAVFLDLFDKIAAGAGGGDVKPEPPEEA